MFTFPFHPFHPFPVVCVYLFCTGWKIRFGDHDPAKHKPGFLADGLETFVPAHLLHNQLKTMEWERRIYTAHASHLGHTDTFLLHRLFMQYCWQV